MTKALELKPGQKFKLYDGSMCVYVVPHYPDLDPAIACDVSSRNLLTVKTTDTAYTFNERFANNPEVILTDEKITI